MKRQVQYCTIDSFLPDLVLDKPSPTWILASFTVEEFSYTTLSSSKAIYYCVVWERVFLMKELQIVHVLAKNCLIRSCDTLHLVSHHLAIDKKKRSFFLTSV